MPRTEDEWTDAERRCLQRLFLTDPETDMNALKRRKGGRAPGTCEWILETDELKAWSGKSPGSCMDRSNILWLYGYPGIGKSTMAIALAEMLPDTPSFREKNKILVYFFCDSNSEDRRTATGILRGLLYQISHNSRKLMRPLRMKHDIQGDKLFSSFDALWDLLMEIGQEHAGEIYCIIDALDECDSTAQETLLTQISDSFLSRSNTPGVHILITSRPYEEIRSYLDDFPSHDLGAYDKVQGDLEVIIHQKVNQLARKKNYPKSLKDRAIAILKQKAEGTFLWVGIACDELMRVRLRDVVKTLQELPRSLDSLYRSLLDRAIEQNEDNQDTIIRILGFVATARRPLTILELLEACQLYTDMGLEERLAYIHEDITMCRLLIVVQGSIVSLLHKSLKDFLTSSEHHHHRVVDERNAHASFAHSCIDRLLEASRTGGELQVSDAAHSVAHTASFLQYSAENWPVHAHLAKDRFTILDRHRAFFEFRSEIREQWLEYIRFPRRRSNYAKVPYNMSIYHIAARWGVPCLIHYALPRLDGSSAEPTMQRGKNHNVNALFSGGRTPLEESALAGHADVFQLLLEQTHGRIMKEAAVAQAAIGNKQAGRQMIELLLDREECEIQITQALVIQAVRNGSMETVEFLVQRLGGKLFVTDNEIRELARNRQIGAAVLDLFFNRLVIPSQLPENVLETVAMHGNAALVTILLDRLGSGLSPSSSVASAAVSNVEYGLEMLKLLLGRFGERLPITPGINLFGHWSTRVELWHHREDLLTEYKALLRLVLDRLGGKLPALDALLANLIRSHSRHGGEVLLLLLQGRPEEIPTTQDLLEAAANTGHEGLMQLVLTREITDLLNERVLSILARRGTEGVMQSLLHRLGDDSLITESVIENAALNEGRNGLSILRLFCARLGDRIPITEGALRRVVSNKGLGLIMLDLLLEQLQERLPVTENTFITAAYNKAIGPEIISRLVHRFGDKIPCSVVVLETAAKGKDGAVAVIQVLLSHVKRGLVDMEDLLINVASAGCAGLMMQALNDYEGGSVTITEDVLVAAAQSQDKATMQFVLGHAGRVILNEQILKAAAGDIKKGNQMLQLLLAHPACEVQMSQELLHTIIYSTSSEEVSSLLLGSYKGELPVTEGLFKATLDHGSHRLLQRLLDQLDSRQSIPEEVLEQLVRSNFGTRKLSLLLDRRSSSLKFTEVVIEAAARNYYSGRENITILLDRLDTDELPVTISALSSLLKNSQGDFSLSLLLFERLRGKLHFTAELTRAVAAYGDAQLIYMLDYQYADMHITEDVLQAAAGNNNHGEDVLKCLFALNGDRVRLTKGIVEAAAGNYNPGILLFCLDYCQDDTLITPAVLASAAQTTPVAIEALLSRQTKESIITEEVMISALQNYGHGEQIIKLLHRRLGCQMPITEMVLRASAFSYRHAARLTGQLLQWAGDDTLVTESVVKSAVSNRMSGHEVLKLLFNLLGGRVPITEEVLQTAASNFEDGYRVLKLILEQRPGTQITEQVLAKLIAGNRDTAMIELLLEKCGPDAPFTKQVLMAAIGNTSHGYAIMRLLIKKRKQNVHDCLSDGLLSTIAASGNYRILRLFERSFAVTIKEEWLQLARLYRAASESNGPVLDELVGQGVPLDTRNARGETPLWRAASRNHQSVIRKLLQTGLVDVNAVSDSGDSPLISAARAGYTNAVCLLLEAGADPDIANENGNTAYSMAKMRSFFGTMKALERHQIRYSVH